ncbi:hypothetical protein V6N11_054340 [Hibiscus sabdariffa]|uniref:ABC1 atypical kinase-like domain-containing protein n=1 Tax=Hibiscus sabdariffa TaxID=183260 RepID=A0ABR2S3U2_9ROSI
MPTFPDTGAFSCIGRELGMPIESNFSSMSASPIAAAGLCQVYKAQLKYSGQTVTVKVQRPGIEEAIGLDLYVDIIMTDVVVLIDEFARRVYQELNYVQVLQHEGWSPGAMLLVGSLSILQLAYCNNFFEN